MPNEDRSIVTGLVTGLSNRRPLSSLALWGQWVQGYTQGELGRAQEKFGLVFPPDLIALLRERRPAAGHDWADEAEIRRALDWPCHSIVHSVEINSVWWPEWGERPPDADGREEVLRSIVSRAPKLIPLISHRYLPEQPHEPGNPVFSVFGFDAVCYGTDLADYFAREFSSKPGGPLPERAKYIPFWSDLVQRFGYVEEYKVSPRS